VSVGLVFGEERLGLGAVVGGRVVQLAGAEGGVVAGDAAGFGETERGFFGAFLQVVAPAPGVAKAELREQVQGGVVGAAVAGGVAHEQVVGAGLGHGDAHVEVAVVVKGAGVGDLEFGIVQAARGVLRDETAVGVFGLWILVERLHPGVGRGGVEVVVEFLDVLAVVA